MSGSSDLDYLLQSADPVLDERPYVFVSVQGVYGDYGDWDPIASIAEAEGLTLILRQVVADQQGLAYDGVFKRITLRVHSSLAAIGLTASFSRQLANSQISANVVAGFYHDHIFVPEKDADRAMPILASLGSS